MTTILNDVTQLDPYINLCLIYYQIDNSKRAKSTLLCSIFIKIKIIKSCRVPHFG